MKQFMKTIRWIFCGLISLFMGGCYNLDQAPFENLAENEAFLTPEDAQSWVNGAYSTLRDLAYGNHMVLTEAQGDLLNRTLFYDELNDDVHRWEPFVASQGVTANIWQSFYRAIADINKALIGFNQITPQSDITFSYGELYLMRAYYYTTLASLYCKAYDPNTASDDLGLPLLLSDDFTIKLGRASLEDTYQQILSDLYQAETFLNGKQDITGTTFTQHSALALKARVLLYMQNWTEAFTCAKRIIDTGSYPLANDQDIFKSIWKNDDSTESITQLFATNNIKEQPQTQAVKAYLGRDEYNGSIVGYFPTLLPTQTVVDWYDNDDWRKNVFFSVEELYSTSGTPEQLFLVSKFTGNTDLKVGNDVSYAHQPKIFRIAEQYLIAAEAAYQNHDFTNAQIFINELKQARNLPAISLTGISLYQEIQQERTRELAFEGFRLMDLKRWKLPINRGVAQHLDFIATTPAEQYHLLNRPANDHKTVWPIPISDLTTYPNLVKQNENW